MVLLDSEELTLMKTWRMADVELAPTIVLDKPLVVQPMTHQAMLSKSRPAQSTTAAMTSTLTQQTESVKALKPSPI